MQAFPGNTVEWPPYMPRAEDKASTEAHAKEPMIIGGVVECESVGTVYMVPASVSGHAKLQSVSVPCSPV